MTPAEQQVLDNKQTRFLSLFQQWTHFIYRFLYKKGFKEPKYMEYLVKDIQGYLWAQFDGFDSERGAFSTWTGWQLKAWIRDRAIAIRLGRGDEGTKVQRVRRIKGSDKRPSETRNMGSPQIMFSGLNPQFKPARPNEDECQQFNGTFTTNDPTAEISLRLAIASLPEKDRQLITLLEAGNSIQDIASVLGLEYSTLHMRIVGIRKRMAVAMKHNDTPTKQYAHDLVYWREYFKTEIVFPNHIRKQLYAQKDHTSPQSRRT